MAGKNSFVERFRRDYPRQWAWIEAVAAQEGCHTDDVIASCVLHLTEDHYKTEPGKLRQRMPSLREIEKRGLRP